MEIRDQNQIQYSLSPFHSQKFDIIKLENPFLGASYNVWKHWVKLWVPLLSPLCPYLNHPQFYSEEINQYNVVSLEYKIFCTMDSPISSDAFQITLQGSNPTWHQEFQVWCFLKHIMHTQRWPRPIMPYEELCVSSTNTTRGQASEIYE